MLGDGAGNFASPVAAPHDASAEFVVVGDFNGDGRLDFAINNSFAINGNIFVTVEEQIPVAFYPQLMTFPPQDVGTTSPPQTMKFANVGAVPLNISNTVVEGYLGSFTGTNDCPATLQVGADCTFTVTFTPTFVGRAGGMVSVTDNALGSVQVGGLEGQGK